MPTPAECPALVRRLASPLRTSTDDQCDRRLELRLLGPDEQRGFRRLGALPGGFAIDAAAAVLGRDGRSATHEAALTAIAAVIDKSLFARGESSPAGRPLYRMLDTVPAYAARELTAREREDAMNGLASYCGG